MCRWVFSVLCKTLELHVQGGLLDSWSHRKPHKYSLAPGFSMSAQLMFWVRSFFAALNCPARCLAAALTSTHQMPAVLLPLNSGHCKNGSRHCKTSPGRWNHPCLKTIAPASHWSRRNLIEEQDMFLLHSHKLDLCWFHNIFIQRSSICDICSTGCHRFTKEIKSVYKLRNI